MTLIARKATYAGLLTLMALAAALAAGAFTQESGAALNPNNYDCRGHIEKGAPAPGDEDEQVKYVFGCSGPITGYQIQSSLPMGSFQTDPVAIGGDGQAVTTDSFSCNGDIPGLAVNCVGAYTGTFTNNRYEQVIGQFSIPSSSICDEPRVDPLLTVVYATADKAGKVTQAISGPYDLGRPHGCPVTRYTGIRRIPKGGFDLGATATPKPAKKG